MRINISTEDVTAAENFLTEYLTEAVPEGSFQPGSALRDLAVQAFANIFAFLRGEVAHVSKMQSLKKVQDEADVDGDLDSPDVSQMVDEILSNWFVSRNSGTHAKMTAQIHFTQRATVTLRSDIKFWRTPSLVFYLDIVDGSLVIPSDSMRPVYDTKGRLIDYVADIPLKAARTGDSYNLSAGRFTRVESPSGIPYLSYVNHSVGSSDGSVVETTADLIERAQNVVTVRNLINNRSIDTVLQNEFPDIWTTLTVGMGEPEMLRDKRLEVAEHIELHVGGHYDTYIEMPEGVKEENATIGRLFPRPDGKAMVFRDPQLTYDGTSKKFTDLGVQPGHVLYIRSGIVGSPRGYTIHGVFDDELHVSEATPFTQASDELTTNAVEYSIGWLSPYFDNVNFDNLPAYSFVRTAAVSANPTLSYVTAGTSRRLRTSGGIYLSGNPILDILSVELTNPDSSDPFKDPTSGTIKFQNRTNLPPIQGSVVGTSQYQVTILNPEKSQSAEAVIGINVGYYDPDTGLVSAAFDEKNLRVRYKTLPGFMSVHNYTKNISDRVLAANHLVRARHNIWISAMIPVRYKPTVAASSSFEEIQSSISAFINAFDANDYLDMSDLMTELRVNYNQISTVFPFDITYALNLPDGQVAEFSTTDIVSILVTDTNGVTLTNGDEIVVPAALQSKGITSISTGNDLLELYNYSGISDRTVVYRSRPELITVYLRS